MCILYYTLNGYEVYNILYTCLVLIQNCKIPELVFTFSSTCFYIQTFCCMLDDLLCQSVSLKPHSLECGRHFEHPKIEHQSNHTL